jgi:hypothetical protein
MSDALDSATPKKILVDSHDGNGSRNPSADEVITVSDSTILSVAAADADGNVFVSVTAGAADQALATISVAPGAADVGQSAGSDDVTVTVAAVLVPLGVSLG